MDRIELRDLLRPLTVLYGIDFDVAQWLTYYRALADVPAPLLVEAVNRAGQSLKFMPKPAELRAFAEDARRSLLAAHPFSACAACDESGWVEIEISGVKRVKRCQCWNAWQAQLANFGVTSAPLALPPAEEPVPSWSGE